MKILITGGAGFIASHIVDAYIDLGHEVTIVDDFSSGKKKNIHPRAHVVTLDIREPEIHALFTKSRFDIVNHHAAQIDVRRSVQDPSLDASINILGTLRLLECCRTYGIGKFIFASSGGAIYGECEKNPAVETGVTRPESPYGFSKLAAETYIRFFEKYHHVAYTILRYSNVYGPRQDIHGEAGVISIFIGQLLSNKSVTIYGTGQQERDYVYVEDVVAANCAALTKGENGTYNIGTQRPTSVNALFEKIAKVHGSASAPLYAPARPGELERSVLDISSAQRTLQWQPTHSLESGLEKTYSYFKHQPKSPSHPNTKSSKAAVK